MSQDELARLAGISRITLTKLERLNNPTEAQWRTIRKLAEALGCEPRELTGRAT